MKKKIYLMIFCIKNRKPNEPLHIFNIGRVNIGKNFTFVNYHQTCLIPNLYNIIQEYGLRKVLKFVYTSKIALNINGNAIHSSFKIPINKNLHQLMSFSDEKIHILIKRYVEIEIFVA
jgi:hypothetical protein